MKVKVIVSFLIFSVGLNLNSFSQTIDDWKNCLKKANENKKNYSKKGYAGAESIPYSDIKREVDIQYATHKIMATTKMACNSNDHGTRKLRNDIKKLERSISAESDESRKDNLEKKLDQNKEELEDRIKKCQTRVDYCTKVYNARVKVKEQYEKAIHKAKYERDPEIKAIAEQLIDYWENDNEEHEEALDTTRQSIKKCKACKSGDS